MERKEVNKRLYELKVDVLETRIYHVHAEDEAELNYLWMNGKACKGEPARIDYVRQSKRNWKMIKNKENVKTN